MDTPNHHAGRRHWSGRRPRSFIASEAVSEKSEAASLLPCSHWCSHGTRSHQPIAAESRWTARALLSSAPPSRGTGARRGVSTPGLRRGEALALRWSDVDLTNGFLLVRGTLARANGHPVISEAQNALKDSRYAPLLRLLVAKPRAAKRPRQWTGSAPLSLAHLAA